MNSYIWLREQYYNKAIELRSSGMSCESISKIIPVSAETIRRWYNKFADGNYQRVRVMKKKGNKAEPSEPTSALQSQPESNDVKELQEELKRLRAQLRDAEIKAEAYDELINVAEAKFNIQIRKKAGAKQ